LQGKAAVAFVVSAVAMSGAIRHTGALTAGEDRLAAGSNRAACCAASRNQAVATEETSGFSSAHNFWVALCARGCTVGIKSAGSAYWTAVGIGWGGGPCGSTTGPASVELIAFVTLFYATITVVGAGLQAEAVSALEVCVAHRAIGAGGPALAVFNRAVPSGLLHAGSAGINTVSVCGTCITHVTITNGRGWVRWIGRVYGIGWVCWVRWVRWIRRVRRVCGVVGIGRIIWIRGGRRISWDRGIGREFRIQIIIRLSRLAGRKDQRATDEKGKDCLEQCHTSHTTNLVHQLIRRDSKFVAV
jgi:hypothetical protein